MVFQFSNNLKSLILKVLSRNNVNKRPVQTRCDTMYTYNKYIYNIIITTENVVKCCKQEFTLNHAFSFIENEN